MLTKRLILAATVILSFILSFAYFLDFHKVYLIVKRRAASAKLTVVPHGAVTVVHAPLDLNRDVLVLLKIPRTGVTALTRHIIDNSDIRPRCESRLGRKTDNFGWTCTTKENAIWLVSSMTDRNIYPRLADYTTLKEGLDKSISELEHSTRTRRYHYVTMLRDPVERFRSEFFYSRRSSWTPAMLACNGEAVKPSGIKCFRLLRRVSGSKTFNEFINCTGNNAGNRQTRMLADLKVVGCYKNETGLTEHERDRKVLNSAKDTLLKMSFFGLTEYQYLSQRIFEKTFHVKFLSDFRQFHITVAKITALPSKYAAMISEFNRLDIELYEYAKRLFLKKAEYFNLI